VYSEAVDKKGIQEVKNRAAVDVDGDPAASKHEYQGKEEQGYDQKEIHQILSHALGGHGCRVTFVGRFNKRPEERHNSQGDCQHQ